MWQISDYRGATLKFSLRSKGWILPSKNQEPWAAEPPSPVGCSSGRGLGWHICSPTGWLSIHVCGCSEAYPGCVVTRVHFCYDVRTLIELDDQR